MSGKRLWLAAFFLASALMSAGCPEAPATSAEDGGSGVADDDSGLPEFHDGGTSVTPDGGLAETDAGDVADGGDPADGGDGGSPSLGAGFGRYLPSQDVRATLVQGTTLYLGGIFNRMQANVGPFVAVNNADGTIISDLTLGPQLMGAVYDGAPLDDGGLIILGNLYHYGTAQWSGIAKIRPDGNVDPLWSPEAGFVGGTTITTHADTAYLARAASSSSGQPLLATVDLDTGDADEWDALFAKDGAPNAYLNIRDLLVVGEKLYVAGDFSHVDGEARPGVAAFDLQGNLDATFAPQIGQLDVYDIDVMGNTLLVAGAFTLDEGGADERRGLLGLESSTGALTDWAPELSVGGRASALAVDGAQVFIGGTFSSVNGEARTAVASLDADGALNEWSLPPGNASFLAGPVVGSPTSLSVVDGALYGVGSLLVYDIEQGTVKGNNAFAADVSTGALLDWNPSPGAGASFVAPLGDGLGIGGTFRVAGGESRTGAAAIDLVTGDLLDWNPLAGRTGSAVYDIVPRADGLVLAGYFGGADPAELVVAHPVSGALIEEIQIAGFQDGSAGIFTRGSTDVLVLDERTCVAGNTLVPIDTPSPGKVVCLDSAGEIAFSLDADNYVWALEEIDGELAVGGSFTTLGAEPTGPLARVDESGQLVDWSPNLAAMEFERGFGGVSSLVNIDGMLYASGDLLVEDVAKSIVSINADASLAAFQVERPANAAATFKLGASGAQLLGAANNVVSVYETDDAEPVRTWSLTEVHIPYGVHKLGELLIVGGSSFAGRHLNASLATSP